MPNPRSFSNVLHSVYANSALPRTTWVRRGQKSEKRDLRKKPNNSEEALWVSGTSNSDQKPERKNDGPAVCNYFRENGKCRWGKRCHFKHIDKDGTVVHPGSKRTKRRTPAQRRQQIEKQVDKAVKRKSHEAQLKAEKEEFKRLKTEHAKLANTLEKAKIMMTSKGIDATDVGLVATEKQADNALHAGVNPDGTITMKFDSGASDTMVGETIPTKDNRTCNVTIETAGTGNDIHVSQAGTLDVKEEHLMTSAKKSNQFSHNLFSALQAVKGGCKCVLDLDRSYIEHKESGTIYPLTLTSTGWDLTLNQRQSIAAFGGAQ